NGIDAFITADYLFWTARVDGCGYAFTGAANGGANPPKGSVQHPDWEWKSGFKGGLGLDLPHDGWDLYCQYTYFHSQACDAAEGNTLQPLWNIGNTFSISPTSTINQARVKWKLKFNAVDLELGRNYFISRFLTLRPHIGLKGSWQDQNYRVHYQLAQGQSVLTMASKQEFWGIGLRGGLKSGWYLNKNFSVYGDLAIGALWSQFSIDRQDSGSTILLNTNNNFHTIKAILEFGLGLRAEIWAFEERYHFLLQAGWEEQIWINQNNLMKLTFEESSQGDLILQGFTIKARFDF
ncbi:MAG: MOMP family protein, partial [Simkania negevensis]|nr:MOMP family protein [Simkania negevensis]